MAKPLIVGIDVGTTSGIAIFDLNRNLLYSGSKRGLSTSEMINQILKFGKPLMISTDKRKVPSKINKIAASFNCKVFSPDHDLGVEEKESIVKISIKNPHEKDALAAAMFAYRKYGAQFTNIDRTLASRNLQKYSDRIKEMIINKEAKNIAEAIEKIKPKKEEKVKEIIKEINIDWRIKAKEYKRKLIEQKRSYEILKLYTDKLENRVKNLEKQKQNLLEEEMKKKENVRRKIMREKELRSKDILIKQLQFELAKQKSFSEAYKEQLRREQEFREIREEDLIPVITISNFTKESIANANKEFGIKNKVIWFKEIKSSKPALKFLLSLKPKIVIAEVDDKTRNTLKNSRIMVTDGIKPEVRRYYSVVSADELEDLIKKTEKKSFLNWLEEYKRR